MHPLKKQLIAELIEREGGYINHPADRGGPTKYGVTQAVARAHGWTGDMRDMPIQVAEDIYADAYWNPNRLDVVVEVSEKLALFMFDYGVHSGTSRAGRDLQRLLNVLNRVERDYFDIVADGLVGPATLGALDSFFASRGREGVGVLESAYNGLRQAFMVELSEAKESQEAFTYGWLKRVFELGVG